MEHVDTKFKRLAVEFAIHSGMYASTEELIEDARVIESYLKEADDTKPVPTVA